MRIKRFKFNENKVFWTVESIIFIVLLTITILEVKRFGYYDELFKKYGNYALWFFGLTFGIVFANMKTRVKDKINTRFNIRERKETSFPLFLGKLMVVVFFSSVLIGLARYYLTEFLFFTPVMISQWLVLLYIWFKFENQTRPSLKYIIANELIIVFCLILLLVAFL